ncbi:hypothetical protein SNL152K_10233 [Streptomyces sp. NL15-2K]|nr:hypothetical protein SNL152K_10233 [Streptomyces sp. NL15-2K]
MLGRWSVTARQRHLMSSLTVGRIDGRADERVAPALADSEPWADRRSPRPWAVGWRHRSPGRGICMLSRQNA